MKPEQIEDIRNFFVMRSCFRWPPSLLTEGEYQLLKDRTPFLPPRRARQIRLFIAGYQHARDRYEESESFLLRATS